MNRMIQPETIHPDEYDDDESEKPCVSEGPK